MHKPALVHHYWRRASGFKDAAMDLSDLDKPRYAAAIGLLSVHACIALADAVLVSVGEKQSGPGKQPREQDHREAVRRLSSWCDATKVDRPGLKHFDWLLERKNKFSYDGKHVDEAELEMAKVKMEQFFVWVSQAFPNVGRPEEESDDA